MWLLLTPINNIWPPLTHGVTRTAPWSDIGLTDHWKCVFSSRHKVMMRVITRHMCHDCHAPGPGVRPTLLTHHPGPGVTDGSQFHFETWGKRKCYRGLASRGSEQYVIDEDASPISHATSRPCNRLVPSPLLTQPPWPGHWAVSGADVWIMATIECYNTRDSNL